MRTLKLSAMAIAALCLAACSETAVVEQPAPEPVEKLVVDSLPEGYLGFGIQLPTLANSGTRANDDFADGDDAEYAVKTGVLVLFEKAAADPEDNATFCGAYDLLPSDLKGFSTTGTGTQCTTHAVVVKKIDNTKLDTNKELWAYVILNHHMLFTDISSTTLTVDANGTPKTVTKATKFSEFKQYILKPIGEAALGFVMTNAPLASNGAGTAAPATGTTVTTLAKLDKAKIKSTEDEAKADVTGDIYVERAAVKVTVTGSSASDSYFAAGKLEGGSTALFTPTSIKWTLGNENSTYYNTRQYEASWVNWENDNTIEGNPINPWRFISKTATHTDGDFKVGYRTYWAKDANYDADASPALVGIGTGDASKLTLNAGDNAYTWENTFDVGHMSFRNTTYVALQITFNGGNDFYTSSYTGDKVVLSPSYKSSTEIDCIQEVIHDYLMNNSLDYYNNVGAHTANDLTITWSSTIAPGGTREIDAIAGSGWTLPASITKDLINSAIKFKYYAGGKVYYNVRLKHFGADAGTTAGCETPWDIKKHATNSIKGAYQQYVEGGVVKDYAAPKPENYFTGRYGLVRNNWYQLEITGIKAIGTPTPVDPNGPGPDPDDPDPKFPDTPDDEVESYVGVEIHVMPWALRKQGAVL